MFTRWPIDNMTTEEFRSVAFAMLAVSESAHMGHPDFRVGGKIFATLGYPDERFGVVMLGPQEQENFLRSHPSAFAAAKGAWGRRGSTPVRLDAVDAATLRKAIGTAWRIRASKRLSKQLLQA